MEQNLRFNRSDVKREHPMNTLLKEIGIKHHKIRPRTPEHTGKVERSHRNDNERFYSYLKFYSLEDLRKQGAAYLKRSNRIPMAVLGYLTPKEKREELKKHKYETNSIILFERICFTSLTYIQK